MQGGSVFRTKGYSVRFFRQEESSVRKSLSYGRFFCTESSSGRNIVFRTEDISLRETLLYAWVFRREDYSLNGFQYRQVFNAEKLSVHKSLLYGRA